MSLRPSVHTDLVERTGLSEVPGSLHFGLWCGFGLRATYLNKRNRLAIRHKEARCSTCIYIHAVYAEGVGGNSRRSVLLLVLQQFWFWYFAHSHPDTECVLVPHSLVRQLNAVKMSFGWSVFTDSGPLLLKSKRRNRTGQCMLRNVVSPKRSFLSEFVE
jgi:hypothetical protein